MAFDFPASPSPGQVYQGYTWDGEKWLQSLTTVGVVRYDTAQVLSPAQQVQALANINSPTNAGYFTFISTTSVQFQPYNGDLIKINGVIYRLPGSISAANTSVFVNGVAAQNLAASTLYYVYLFNNSGTLTIDFSTTVPALSATTGNAGTSIKTGDDTRSLIGMAYTNASSQFAASNVISWFNKKSRQLTASSTGGGSPCAVVDFSTWGDEAIYFGIQNSAQNGTLQGATTVTLNLDGAVSGMVARNDAAGANSVATANVSSTRLLTAGRHQLGQNATYTGTPSNSSQETAVLFRG